MQLVPYLNFNGRCEEAFGFYRQCLGGKIEAMVPFGETASAEHVPPNWSKKIMHAQLSVGGQTLMGSDAPPDRYGKPAGFAVSVQVEDSADAERIFKSLAKDGRTTMPIQETFFAARFGMLTDRFGVPWMINCAKSN